MVMKPCIERGCTALITTDEGPRCPDCRRKYAREGWEQGRTGSRGNRPGWSHLRKKVIRRDGHRCQECGTPNSLHVHHIDGDARNDAMTNLRTLCEDCHKDADAELREQRAA